MSCVESILIFVNISASGILGVINKVFFINFFFMKIIAVLLINFVPPFATITGSRTNFFNFNFFKDLITAKITSLE